MYLQDFFLKHVAYSFTQPAPLLSVPIFAEKRKGFPLPIAIGIRAINNPALPITRLGQKKPTNKFSLNINAFFLTLVYTYEPQIPIHFSRHTHPSF